MNFIWTRFLVKSSRLVQNLFQPHHHLNKLGKVFGFETEGLQSTGSRLYAIYRTIYKKSTYAQFQSKFCEKRLNWCLEYKICNFHFIVKICLFKHVIPLNQKLDQIRKFFSLTMADYRTQEQHF